MTLMYKKCDNFGAVIPLYVLKETHRWN